MLLHPHGTLWETDTQTGETACVANTCEACLTYTHCDITHLASESWFSKCGPWTSSSSFRELIRNANSQVTLDLLDWNLWGCGPAMCVLKSLRMTVKN